MIAALSLVLEISRRQTRRGWSPTLVSRVVEFVYKRATPASLRPGWLRRRQPSRIRLHGTLSTRSGRNWRSANWIAPFRRWNAQSNGGDIVVLQFSQLGDHLAIRGCRRRDSTHLSIRVWTAAATDVGCLACASISRRRRRFTTAQEQKLKVSWIWNVIYQKFSHKLCISCSERIFMYSHG